MSIHRPDPLPLRGEHSLPGGYFTVTRCRRCGIVVGYGDKCEFCSRNPDGHVDAPGELVGRHHTEWIATIDELVAAGNDDDAELLLWRLLDAVEAEVHVRHAPPFERHFTRLVQLARRRGDEPTAKRVLDRYEACRALAGGAPAAEAG